MRGWRRLAPERQRVPPPPPAAVGALDAPGQGATVEGGALTVEGWASFPTEPTSRVEVQLGGEPLGRAQIGVARPDLRELPGHEDARLAGFSLTAELPGRIGAGDEVELTAEAVSIGGARLELGPQTVAIAAPPPPPQPGPPVAAPPRRGIRVLACTHQLCLGGASRHLHEMLGELLRIEAVDPVVLSPIGGPLRPRLEALGIRVHVSGSPPLDDVRSLDARTEELAAWAAPQDFELVLVNTVSPLTLAAAGTARRLGVPAVWLIHESFDPEVLWAPCEAGVRRRGEEILSEAALAIFEAEGTQRIYDSRLGERGVTIPYGLDLAPVEELRPGFDRAAERRRLGIAADADLIVCAGVIEPRKAQAQLAQAFALIAARHPRAELALLGAEGTPDSELLAEWVASSSCAGRVRIVPTTPEIHAWYGVADLFVCASRNESLPRAVVEGMAWELPVLATAIFGLAELIEDGENGWLCEDGDTATLAGALDRVLGTGPAERARIGRAGRETVERRHALEAYGAEVARLLERIGGKRFA